MAAGLEAQRAYWRRQLEGCVPVLQLPLDGACPAGAGRTAAALKRDLGADALQQAAISAAELGVPLEALLLAAVQLVLLRFSGQDEVLVGVPAGGAAGLLPIRRLAPAEEGASFADAALATAAALEGARSHASLPLQEIADTAGARCDPALHPLFQAACWVVGKGGPQLSKGAKPGVAACAEGAPLDLCFTVDTDAGELLLEYAAELFSTETAAMLADALCSALRHAAAQPRCREAAVPLLGDAGARDLLARFAARELRPEFVSGPLVHEMFEQEAAARPEAPCLASDSETLSYAEVNRRANQLAHALLAKRAGADRVVALLLDRSPEYMIAMLAVLKSGRCFVPLDPNYPEDRLGHCMEDAGPLLLLSQGRHDELARSLGSSCPSDPEVILLDHFWSRPSRRPLGASEGLSAEANPRVTVAPSSLAYILFTSGSTGRPKGVQVMHRGLADFTRGVVSDFKVTHADVCLFSITCGFDAHIYQVIPPLASGGCLAIAKPDGHTDPAYIAGLIRRHRVSWTMTVPTLATLYLEALRGEPCESLRLLIVGGESLPRKLISFINEVLPRCSLVNAYGPTEVTVTVTSVHAEHLTEAQPITLGPPEPNVHCYIVTPQQQKGPLLTEGAAAVAPVGAPGELLLSGPRLARGYAQRPEQTAATFVPNPFYDLVTDSLPEEMRSFYRLAYRTGDLVRWRPDGTIEYLGRIDQQIKIDGVRMEIDEIEAVLAAAPGVSQAAVAPQVSGGRKRLVGYVVPEGVDIEVAREYCRSKLTPAMVPSVLLALGSLPLLANGKVNKKALPPPPEAAPAAEEYVGPESEVESTLQDFWAEVLGLGQPSVTADFFSLGGTSLKAGMIQALIQRHFGLDSLPPNLVLLNRTIRESGKAVAAALAGAPAGAGAAPALAGVPHHHWTSVRRPLSANQEQMWLLHSMGLAAAYNMQAASSMTGPLDLAALKAALHMLVERHELLRMLVYEEGEGTAAGRVLLPADVPVPLRELDCAASPAAISRALEAELAEPFDLSRPPYMRVLLLRHSPDHHTLGVTMHHITGDAWSYGVLQRDLSQLYNAALEGRPSPLEPLPIEYSDFAAWQLKQLSGSTVIEAQRAYWRRQLEGCVPVLQLPLDRPRPAEPSFKAAVLQLSLGKPLMREAGAAARALHVSLQAFVMAALQLVLLRYSGQDEVTVGIPTAGRQQPETHPVIGYFVNPLPIRAVPAEGATFADLASSAAAAIMDALSNSLLPMQEVVEAAGVVRQPGVNPLFQVMTQVLDEAVFLPHFDAVASAPLAPEAQPPVAQAKMEVYFQLDTAGELRVEYMTELFDERTVRGLAESLRTVLAHAAAHPHAPAAAVPLLAHAAADDLLARLAVRELRLDYLESPLVHQLFERAAAAAPEAPCLAFDDFVLSYAEVDRRANQLAHVLIGKGAGADRAVALLLDRSPEYMVAVLAVLKSGSCFLPLDPNYPEDRLGNCMEDAEAVQLLSQARHRELARSLASGCPSNPEVMFLDEFWSATGAGADSAATNPGVPVDRASLAYILFTSGSTGRPKGVQVLHRGLVDFTRGVIDDFKLTPRDVGLFSVTCGFDAHIYVMPALASGGCLAIASPDGHTDPAYMAAFLRRHRVSWFLTVPTLAALYLEALQKQPCDSMRFIITGGESLPRKLISHVRNALPQTGLINAYGPTEVTVAVSWARVEGLTDAQPVTIGRPDPNVHCYIVTPQQQKGPLLTEGAAALAPVGAPGELLLSGPRLARGYAQRPDQTAAAFVPNPCYALVEASLPEALRPFYRLAYRTGDLVRWRPGGTIEYLGRIDQQVKIDGVRMEIDEIEAVLAAAPGVSQAAVAPQGTGGRKRLVGYVVPGSVDLDKAKAHCRSKLTPAMVPSVMLALGSLPLLANGKVDKKALPPPPEVAAAAAAVQYQAPQNELEQAIQEIWMDVLDLHQPLSVTADFFSVGGSSLKAGVIQGRIREGLHVPGLSGTAVLQYPTVRALAGHVAAILEREEAQPGRGGRMMTFLLKGFTQRWQAGHGDSTRRMLAAVRTFRSKRLLQLLSAEDPRLQQRLASQPLPACRLPYPLYVVLQYLLVLVAQLPPLLSWLAQLLLLALFYYIGWGTGWLALLWVPVSAVGQLVVAASTVVVTWVLLPRRLKPGLHPVWGWLHCRWAAVRAIQRAGMGDVAPYWSRTPVLNCFYRLLGASIGRGALLDTGRLQDPQLISIGRGARLGRGVSAAGVTVVPAGMLGGNAEPVLLVSDVHVGEACEVGHKAVLPGGSRLAGGMHLKPRMAPSHPGAVEAGPMEDAGMPEFDAEAHLGPTLSVLLAALQFIAHAFIMLPGLVAVFAIMGAIYGQNPLAIVSNRLYSSWQLNTGAINWQIATWPLLFLVLYNVLGEALGSATHTLALVAFKRLVLGRLPPGTNLLSSRWLLLRYAFFARMLDDPLHLGFRNMLSGTTAVGTLYRWLGAEVGACVFLGGLTTTCPDALSMGDLACSGGDSCVYGIGADGVVGRVVVSSAATIGNAALLYPGAHMQPGSLVGNDTVLAAGELLPAHVRKQGAVQYTVGPGVGVGGGKDAELGEKGLEPGGGNGSTNGSGGSDKGSSSAAAVNGHSARNGQGMPALPADLAAPVGHTIFYALASLGLLPSVAVVRWAPFSLAFMVVVVVAGGWGVPVYVACVGGSLSLGTAWLWLLPHLVGMPRYWHAGRASVFSIAAGSCHGLLSNAMYDPLLETPFMAWAARGLGFKVGGGAILMGYLPLERYQVSIGAGAVVESFAFVEGHYLESLRFEYKTCSVGERAWVQQGARVMPGVTMGSGARLLPGCTVLPGEVLGQGMLWGGGVPASPQGRAVPGATPAEEGKQG